jgi:hypothetical protein
MTTQRRLGKFEAYADINSAEGPEKVRPTKHLECVYPSHLKRAILRPTDTVASWGCGPAGIAEDGVFGGLVTFSYGANVIKCKVTMRTYCPAGPRVFHAP